MRKGKGGGRGNGLLPNSIRIISSCLRTVSTNAGTVVRSAGATVAASIAAAVDDQKDQVLWAGFDKLELGPTAFRHVLLLGYSNGFQVVDIEDSSNVRELVSKRDGPVTFLQMLPIPNKLEGHEAYRSSHPLLLVVAGDEANDTTLVQGAHLGWPTSEPQPGHGVPTPTAVRFYSLRSYSYVHVLRFRSAVYMIRCSPRIIAVALAAQIYCFDAITLENKFSLLTYPMPQGGQGVVGVNIGYGPMAVGPRWLAYASNNPLLSNTGRLTPQNLTPSPGVSPSTSPSSGNLVARYAMESSKQLAAGIINLGDIGYKTLSKYCQDFLPDGSSSPVSPSSSWKVGKVTSAAHPTEADNAGMVVIKDFVSKAIVSQFRAHTSPISALCFDPTGTLLVTASVHGHSINVFRIMPSRVQSASDSACYDWSSSHVHLYKLYRGLTAAVIQDICFSHYSQWVAIVSSRGTCHIFVFPFGGDVGLKTQSAHNDVPPLLPSLSSPWWSASSCMTNQQPRPPPPPVTLSVVSRVKNGNFGLLNTISNAATSATGRISVPSGAVAAIFHNSIYKNLQQVHLKCNALEHLIVYSPSGHIIQHDLLLSSGIESCDDNFRSGLGQLAPVQDEELRVRAEPVQWWDVCRRSNWPEREVYFSGMTLDRFETAAVVMDTSDCEDNDTMYLESHKNTSAVNYLAKTHEKPHWYLSNAEVQISSGRIPIWQKSKICIYTMIPFEADELKFVNEFSGGEIEIEKIPVHEVEIRRKDLLPVFEHFQSIPSGWVDRELVQGRNQSFSSSGHYTNDKFKEGVGFSRSKSASLGTVESSDVGTTAGTPENLLDLDQVIQVGPYGPVGLQSMETQIPHRSVQYSATTTNFKKELNSEKRGSTVGDDCIISGLSCNSLYVGRPDTEGAFSSSNSLRSETSNTAGSKPFALCPNIHVETEHGDSHNSLHFAQCLHEGYCKISEFDDCRELAEVVNDADSSSSHCEREKPEEDGDSDDMLGGVFAFSEG